MARAFIRKFLRLTQCLLVAALLLWPVSTQGDQAQYFYDELGRLVGVLDGQGNAAVYTYDEVGNLLSIERFTTGTTGIGIFLVTPASGLVGTEVEIQGFSFRTTPTDNQVAFNGTPATVVSATSESIIVTVPGNATTGSVTVTNANGTATSPQAFTVLVPPIIVDVSPGTVPQGSTTQVVIGGFNLATATAVTFSQGGLTATLIGGATGTRLPIDLTVGASVPPDPYAFAVVSPAGTAPSGAVTVTVAPAVPSVGLGTVSVFQPFPAQTPPSGPATSVARGVSVAMP